MKNFLNCIIDDKFIIDNFIDKNGKVSGPKCICIQSNENVLSYLKNRFDDTDEQTTIAEIIYRIQNHIEIVPKCPFCGKRKKFMLIKHYMLTCGDKDCIFEHMENTFINKYGGKSGFGNNNSNDKIKQTMIEKFGVDNPTKSEVIWKQMEQRGTINKSKEEDALYDIFLELFPNTIRNYKSEKYNYFCDFYIPTFDLYIEYHGSMFHRGHLFNENDQSDIDDLKYIESKITKNSRYKFVKYTWVDLDVKKYNAAIYNKLNYLIIYSLFFKNSRSKVRSTHIQLYKEEIKNYLGEFIYNHYKDKTNIQNIIGDNKLCQTQQRQKK